MKPAFLFASPAATPTVVPAAGGTTTTQSIATWLRVLHRANPALSAAGWLSLALGALALLLLPFDQRQVTGLLVWVKPLKFSFSIVAYAWTLGWLLADLPGPAQPAVRRLSQAVALSMLVELACIFIQAARGTTSHYNAATLVDALLFSAMGLFIMLNTLMVGWAGYLLWRYRPHGPAAYVWGSRLGVLLFLLGSLLGGVMIRLNQHTVGAPDGGAGLPGLGWSTRAGDLRIAHFLGMHALQLLPLLGWWLARYWPRWSVALTGAATLAYAALVGSLFWQALQGQPLWAL
jgi:hypothetical protein